MLRTSVAWVWGPVVILTAALTGLPATGLAIATGVTVAIVLATGAVRQRASLRDDLRIVGATLEHAVDAVLAAPHEHAPAQRLRRLCALVEEGRDDVAALADEHARRARQSVGAERWSHALHRAESRGHVARALAAFAPLDPVQALGAERRLRLAVAAPSASADVERLATRGERDAERVVAVAIALRHAQIGLARRPWAVRPYSTVVRLDRDLLRASAAQLAGVRAALAA